MQESSRPFASFVGRRAFTSQTAAMMLSGIGSILPKMGAAQTAYPSKSIRFLVGYPPGGSADVVARLLADALRTSLSHPLVIENLPGASGNIAAQAAARATPDGHILLMGNTAEISINHFLRKESNFDPQIELAPISLAYNITHAIAVPASSKYRKLEDLLADASSPGKVRFASAGVGTPGHLAGEMLALKTGTSLTHIPYKGGSQALADLISGQLECHIAAVSTAMAHVKTGSLRVLAITSPKRLDLLPNIPAVGESIAPGFDFPLWGGVFGSSKIPKDILSLLNREINKALDRPEVQAKLTAQYSQATKFTPSEFSDFLKADADRYRSVIREAKISID